jgi:GrpB-like predicted nucleotidyltransferase (UPF0157 family)
MTPEQNRLARIDQSSQGIDYQPSEAEITPAPMVDPIVVVDYDPAWPDLFTTLRIPVAAALGDVAVAIEHVGSSAVPGWAAKPIIDLDVAIRTETRLPEAIEQLACLGYVYEGDKGIPGRAAFAWPPRSVRHHLRTQYAALKHQLAARYRTQRDAYTQAKGRFVRAAMSRADEWARLTGWAVPDASGRSLTSCLLLARQP